VCLLLIQNGSPNLANPYLFVCYLQFGQASGTDHFTLYQLERSIVKILSMIIVRNQVPD